MTTTNDNAEPISEAEIRLPKASYRLRCIECEKSKSKSGNPMLVQTFEIHSANPITQDGVTIDINGVKIMNWSVLTETAIGPFNAQRSALGLPKVKTSQLGSVLSEHYKGLEGAAICGSEATEQKNDVTGELILNPYTNQPAIMWNKRIYSWFAKPT